MTESENYNSCLQILPIFADLADADLAKIDAIVTERSFDKGEQLFAPGDTADSLIIMHQGQVKLTSFGSDGQEKIINLLQAGDFEGTATLFKPQHHVTYGIAVTPGHACVLQREPFQHIMQETPELALRILNELGTKLVNQQAGYIRNQTTNAEGRVASYLLEYSNSVKTDTFKLPLKKYELASILDLTPETFSRQLKSLAEQGLIQKMPHGQIKIIDEAELSFRI